MTTKIKNWFKKYFIIPVVFVVIFIVSFFVSRKSKEPAADLINKTREQEKQERITAIQLSNQKDKQALEKINEYKKTLEKIKEKHEQELANIDKERDLQKKMIEKQSPEEIADLYAKKYKLKVRKKQ